jgi:hypothetical protein
MSYFQICCRYLVNTVASFQICLLGLYFLNSSSPIYSSWDCTSRVFLLLSFSISGSTSQIRVRNMEVIICNIDMIISCNFDESLTIWIHIYCHIFFYDTVIPYFLCHGLWNPQKNTTPISKIRTIQLKSDRLKTKAASAP